MSKEREQLETVILEQCVAYAMANERYSTECERLHATGDFHAAFDKDFLAQSACRGSNIASERLLDLAKEFYALARREQREKSEPRIAIAPAEGE